ncbi:3-phosphoshikimate 1-carboxyvinyltransferase [Aurantimicrobium photophilum]|uniref:3-phosphoshikimate 1-carboxyvinyltransferase n=1 Tax=Aurantimicrobium photophilum TaxID=1987356 RepID=A0A2Z3S3T2_9MICO|nr:3-phosphoshikimate 1-carboxyvinyltransferase [Aurantimicrobium photophilum]AWR21042.1 3-phosphoshikimate 1-carboxyvinyltransferase [Aurantimicrobium photophilum]
MLTSPYSRPEFDPYGSNDVPGVVSGHWKAPQASQPVTGELQIPGSKSLTNRELVLAALADGPSTIKRPLHSRDSRLMIEALRSLGAEIVEVPGEGAFGPDWKITPGELIGSTTIDCGLAGTVMRFIPPVASLALGPTTFDGDEGARRRPMATTISSLRALGVDVADEGRGSLPFTVHGTGNVAGGALTIDASSSSQFVSGLLLSAARFENGLDLTHSGERLPSLPHIEMTIEVLRARGVKVESPEVGRWIVKPGHISAVNVQIEPDLSNAAPFLAAAVVTGGSVTISGWPIETTQVGNDLLEILPLFGATVSRDGDKVTVTGKSDEAGNPVVHGITLDLTTGGELAPAIVAIAALATTPSTITGIGHIRHHETDRLAALANELNKLGGKVTELEDGLQIEPAELHGGVWLSYEDHRMATSGAIIGLVVPGVEIENIGTTSKTLPEFPELWSSLVESSHS